MPPDHALVKEAAVEWTVREDIVLLYRIPDRIVVTVVVVVLQGLAPTPVAASHLLVGSAHGGGSCLGGSDDKNLWGEGVGGDSHQRCLLHSGIVQQPEDLLAPMGDGKLPLAHDGEGVLD